VSAVDRVGAALRAAGAEADVREFPQGTRTAQEAADAVGCAVGQICKSLVFRLEPSGEPLLVVTSGANRVDVARVAALVGEEVGKADAAFVRERTGFAIGGVPPVGHAGPLRVLVDEDLLAFEVVWAAAGTPNHVFAAAPVELVRLCGGEVCAVAER
jgi:prolyl-tRNA editing enzyme YbaK/EbsC (Cys-tRNA(Pro) deacylase)